MKPGLIAIVDDEPLVRSATSSLLRSLGFDCHTFSSGEDVLRQPLASFACVLSDIQMPGMTGVVLAQHLHHRAPELPIILMTAYPNERAQTLRDAGCVVDLLEKPLDGDLLQATIEAAIRARLHAD
ncbi:response regulator transcription factor [Sphingomonas sp. 2378]|uniref:response regulator transcription factor n=1 Tax=Sphingomonas sp. 2378 TaxID=1219748 RepID=UPI00277F467A|nr:two-component system response regulator FixJ [Sphingomonas sp. SORGH_AS_0879]